jgi:hypothetical protein
MSNFEDKKFFIKKNPEPTPWTKPAIVPKKIMIRGAQKITKHGIKK